MARQPNQGRADLKLGREELEHWSNISGKSTPRCEVKVVKVEKVVKVLRRKAMPRRRMKKALWNWKNHEEHWA
jgi:hypothetical protein